MKTAFKSIFCLAALAVAPFAMASGETETDLASNEYILKFNNSYDVTPELKPGTSYIDLPGGGQIKVEQTAPNNVKEQTTLYKPTKEHFNEYPLITDSYTVSMVYGNFFDTNAGAPWIKFTYYIPKNYTVHLKEEKNWDSSWGKKGCIKTPEECVIIIRKN